MMGHSKIIIFNYFTPFFLRFSAKKKSSKALYPEKYPYLSNKLRFEPKFPVDAPLISTGG